MSTPTPSVTPRMDVKRALFRLLTANADTLGAKVCWGFTARNERRVVMVGSVEGSSEIANITAGQHQRNNTFTIEIDLFVTDGGGLTGEAAEEEAEKLAHAVDLLLANNVKLGGVPGLLAATVGKFDGPDSIPLDKKTGWQAGCSLVVECEMRLT